MPIIMLTVISWMYPLPPITREERKEERERKEEIEDKRGRELRKRGIGGMGSERKW